jgi:hypothetical protein
MKLKEACRIAEECGLETIGEAINNINCHSVNMFKYEDISRETQELCDDFKSSGFSMRKRIREVLDSGECVEIFKDFESSNIEKVEYLPNNKNLIVEYKGGGQYLYEDVSLGEFGVLKESESVGKFVSRVIKPMHKCIKIENKRQ